MLSTLGGVIVFTYRWVSASLLRYICFSLAALLLFSTSTYAQKTSKSRPSIDYEKYLGDAKVEDLGYCVELSRSQEIDGSMLQGAPTEAEVCLAAASYLSFKQANINRNLTASPDNAAAYVDTRENPGASLDQQGAATVGIMMEIFKIGYESSGMAETRHQVSGFELLGECAKNYYGAGYFCDYYIRVNMVGGAGSYADAMGANNLRQRKRGQFIFKNGIWRQIPMAE